MRIVSWNLLEGGQDGASRERLNAAIRILRLQNPDAVLLQEATGFDANNQRLRHHLENSLNMRGFLACARTGYHLATYVRRDQAVGSHEVDTANFFHAMLRVELLLAKSARLHLINAHLCPHSPQVRLMEAQHLARYAGYETADTHVLIGGDFNSLDPHQNHSTALDKMPPYYRARYLMPGQDQEEEDTRVGRSLEIAGFIDIGNRKGDQGYTIPTRLPAYGADFGQLRLDYMYLSPALADMTVDYTVIRTEQTDKCSDHYPVVIDIHFPD